MSSMRTKSSSIQKSLYSQNFASKFKSLPVSMASNLIANFSNCSTVEVDSVPSGHQDLQDVHQPGLQAWNSDWDPGWKSVLDMDFAHYAPEHWLKFPPATSGQHYVLAVLYAIILVPGFCGNLALIVFHFRFGHNTQKNVCQCLV